MPYIDYTTSTIFAKDEAIWIKRPQDRVPICTGFPEGTSDFIIAAFINNLNTAYEKGRESIKTALGLDRPLFPTMEAAPGLDIPREHPPLFQLTHPHSICIVAIPCDTLISDTRELIQSRLPYHHLETMHTPFTESETHLRLFPSGKKDGMPFFDFNVTNRTAPDLAEEMLQLVDSINY